MVGIKKEGEGRGGGGRKGENKKSNCKSKEPKISILIPSIANFPSKLISVNLDFTKSCNLITTKFKDMVIEKEKSNKIDQQVNDLPMLSTPPVEVDDTSTFLIESSSQPSDSLTPNNKRNRERNRNRKRSRSRRQPQQKIWQMQKQKQRLGVKGTCESECKDKPKVEKTDFKNQKAESTEQETFSQAFLVNDCSVRFVNKKPIYCNTSTNMYETNTNVFELKRKLMSKKSVADDIMEELESLIRMENTLYKKMIKIKQKLRGKITKPLTSSICKTNHQLENKTPEKKKKLMILHKRILIETLLLPK